MGTKTVLNKKEAVLISLIDERSCIVCKSVRIDRYLFDLGNDEHVILCRRDASLITKQFMNYIKGD
jgi:hypothetical protein